MVQKSDFGDWYIYDGMQVVGPIDVDKLNQISRSRSYPHSLMVSRRGFDRWYSITEFQDLMQQTSKFADEIQNQKQKLVSSVTSNLEHLTSFEHTIASIGAVNPFEPLVPKVEAHEISTSFEYELAQQTFKSSMSAPQSRASSSSFPLRTSAPAISSNSTVASSFLNHSPAYQYMMLRGRLRLGEKRKLWIIGLWTLLSCGIYYFIWCLNVKREIQWHVHNEFDSKIWSFIVVACIPGGHIALTYLLARSLREAETQNQYAKTSPILAVILSFFPILAMMYLQNRANDHWTMHARSWRG